MLDDLKMIHDKDAQDALGVIAKQLAQLHYEFERLEPDLTGITNIVYAGMGSSALAASVAATWPGFTVPFEIVRSYDLPRYVSRETLFVAASSSGNTEETLSALQQAEERGARVIVIAGGGKMVEIAHERGYPLALLPALVQPRYGVLYNLKAILDMLEPAGVLSAKNIRAEIDGAIEFVQEVMADWQPEVPASDNLAKQLAQELMGRSVVIYSGPLMAPAAYRWKIGINENAKQVAWVGQLPEFNHNEFTGWAKQPVDKPYAVIDIRSRLEHERIQKRFMVSERLLSGRRPAPLVVDPLGDTLLKQMLYAVALGDFTSVYLALLNGIDPMPVELVEKFKKEMER